MSRAPQAPQPQPLGPPGFEEFFRHYCVQVRRYLVWLEAEPGVLDDAVQMTMVSAYRYWDRVGAMDSPTGWLFKVARQRLEDARRTQERGRRPVGDGGLPGAGSAADPMLASDRRLDILAALRTLPRRQQEVVALRMQFGFSYQEIGQIIGASPVTARAHFHRAGKTLEKRLADEEGGTL